MPSPYTEHITVSPHSGVWSASGIAVATDDKQYREIQGGASPP